MSGFESTKKELEEWAERSKSEFWTMPSSVYTCPEWFEAEVEKIFNKEWLCIAHVSEVANKNDFLAIEVYDKPVLLTRDKKGDLRAFSNVCPHRSMILASGSGNKSVISCPYHAWSFQTDGKLRGAPFFTDEERERVKDVCLVEYQLEVWEGMIFINFDENAEPIGPKLAELLPKYQPYDAANYKVVHRGSEHFECNWKVAVENFCESFHIFCVHPQSIELVTSSASTEVWSGGSHFASSMVRTNEPEPEAYTARMPEALREIHTVSSLFPVQGGAALTPSSAVWFFMLPTGPHTTQIHYIISVYAGEGYEEIPQEMVEMGIAGINQAVSEDFAVTPQVQKGHAAGTNKSGPLHQPMEQAVWEFGHYVARTVLDLDVMEEPNTSAWPPELVDSVAAE